MFKHILFPTDGSELSKKSVAEAIAMAKAHGAHITAVHVMGKYHVEEVEGYVLPEASAVRELFYAQRAARAKEILEPVKDAARGAGIECETLILRGDAPYREIVRHAKALQCDLIMMASHDRSVWQRLVHGSETAKVLTHTDIPVLVMH